VVDGDEVPPLPPLLHSLHFTPSVSLPSLHFGLTYRHSLNHHGGNSHRANCPNLAHRLLKGPLDWILGYTATAPLVLYYKSSPQIPHHPPLSRRRHLPLTNPHNLLGPRLISRTEAINLMEHTLTFPLEQLCGSLYLERDIKNWWSKTFYGVEARFQSRGEDGEIGMGLREGRRACGKGGLEVVEWGI